MFPKLTDFPPHWVTLVLVRATCRYIRSISSVKELDSSGSGEKCPGIGRVRTGAGVFPFLQMSFRRQTQRLSFLFYRKKTTCLFLFKGGKKGEKKKKPRNSFLKLKNLSPSNVFGSPLSSLLSPNTFLSLSHDQRPSPYSFSPTTLLHSLVLAWIFMACPPSKLMCTQDAT
jgi:hypothetical protein